MKNEASQLIKDGKITRTRNWISSKVGIMRVTETEIESEVKRMSSSRIDGSSPESALRRSVINISIYFSCYFLIASFKQRTAFIDPGQD